MPRAVAYALSLKQPWASLVVHGLKTIEVRRWPTARRGRILLHAARISDDRPEAWKHVTPDLEASARQLGGIIGAVDLTECNAYPSLEDFVRDQARHLNEPDWFEEAGLYGFTFANPEVLPFRSFPGWMRFFPVTDEDPRKRKEIPRIGKAHPGP